MATCSSCSAPLPANSNRCAYCDTRNDVDLNGRQVYTIRQHSSGRMCPNCKKPLQTIDLQLTGILQIDRCNECFGLFFDPGKIEVLLEQAVSEVYDSNVRQLDNINKDRYPSDQAVKYIKCPVCQNFMHRRAFGYRSGVVVDQCKIHGLWLDSGEITHLLEWKKAGGQLLAAQKELSDNSKPKRTLSITHYDIDRTSGKDLGTGMEVLGSLADIIGTLFKE